MIFGDGKTPLDLAEQMGRHQIKAMLLECRTWLDLMPSLQLNRTDAFKQGLAAYGKPPPSGWLFWAVRSNWFAGLQTMVIAGGDVRAADTEGCSLLFRASENGQAEMARWLESNGCRETIFDAISRGDQAHLQRVLQEWARNDAALNQTNRHGLTPLAAAVISGRPELVSALIAAGASVRTLLRGTWTALDLAVVKNQLAIARMLVQAKAPACSAMEPDGGPLHLAAFLGNSALVQLMLTNGASVSAPAPSSGYTPLHWAAQEGHAEVVRLLLARGADPKTNARTGAWAIDLADPSRSYFRFVPKNPFERPNWPPPPPDAARAACLGLLQAVTIPATNSP